MALLQYFFLLVHISRSIQQNTTLFVLSVWLKNAWPNAQELHSYAQTLSKGAAFRCLGEFTKFETVLLLFTNKEDCK